MFEGKLLPIPRDPITERQMMSKGWIQSPKRNARSLGSMKPFSEDDWIPRVYIYI